MLEELIMRNYTALYMYVIFWVVMNCENQELI